jgi:hypothetical protein
LRVVHPDWDAAIKRLVPGIFAEGRHVLLEVMRYFCSGPRGIDCDGRAERDFYSTRSRVPLARLLQRKQAIQSSRNHRRAKPCGEESYSGAKRSDAAVAREFAFGKYEDAPSAVDQIACERETFAETGLSRQGKDIEESDCCEILQPAEQLADESALRRWAAHRFQALSIHCYGEAPASGPRQGVKDENRIEKGDVIRDHERWPF